MNFYKVKQFCQKFRIALGSILVIAGIVLYLSDISYAKWLFLGFIPLIAGLTNFCPLCIITKKCELPKK